MYATEISIEDYFSSFFVKVERRGDVQNKIKKKRVILKARGMLESAFEKEMYGIELASFPRPRCVFDFLCTSSFALFLSFCWVSRSMLAYTRRIKERKI